MDILPLLVEILVLGQNYIVTKVVHNDEDIFGAYNSVGYRLFFIRALASFRDLLAWFVAVNGRLVLALRGADNTLIDLTSLHW
jgi:hypothetical protein